MRPGLVSVITPVYQGADFIAETLHSIQSQDYPHLEHLVIDDGSTDATPSILDRYRERIRRVSHENWGETRTVNAAFALVRGEFVAVINADDPLRPGAITRLAEALRASPETVLAYPDWEEIDAQGSVLRELRLPHYDLRSMLEHFNVAMGPGVVVRREALRKAGYRDPELRYAADIDLWLRLAAIGPFVHVPELLATHRVQPASASVARRGRRMAAEVAALGRKICGQPQVAAAAGLDFHGVLARAYHAASFYCGGSHGARAGYLLRSLRHAPGYIPLLILRHLRYLVLSAIPVSLRQALRRLRAPGG